MISALAAMMVQAAAPLPAPPAPPPPPPRTTGATRARANLAGLFSDSDYPSEALRNHEEGIVGFRLLVGKDGRVMNCTITSSSGSASLDSTTCRLATSRARFSPARDRRGRPATDSVFARITWRAGDAGLQPFAPTLTIASIAAMSGGALLCSVVRNGEIEEEPRCSDRFNAQLIGAARARGRPVKQTIVTIATPAGEPEPVDSVDHGSRFFAADMDLTIAPDGSIADCRMSLDQGREFLAELPPPGSCPDFARGTRQFEPATGTEAGAPRRMNVKVRGYRRYGP